MWLFILTKELLGAKYLQCAGTVKVKDEFLPLLPILYAALRITPKEMKTLMWNFAWEKNGTNIQGKARTVRHEVILKVRVINLILLYRRRMANEDF